MTGSVVLYTQRGCRFCASAKALLVRRGIGYEEIDLSDDADARVALTARTGRSTLPQLLVGDDLIGGFDELLALDHVGELEARMTDARRSHDTGAPA